MNTNLHLTGQASAGSGLTYFWSYYDGADSPDGSYLGWMSYDNSPTTFIPADVPLGRTNPAGTYYVILKTYQYYGPTNCLVTLGDGSAVSQNAINADDNGRWGFPVAVTSTVSFTNILLQFRKVDSDPTVTEKVMLQGLYITTNQNEAMAFAGQTQDRVINFAHAVTTNDSAGIIGNWLEDSSFELWPSHGWAFEAYFGSVAGTNNGAYSQDYAQADMLSTNAMHGGRSLHVTEGGYVFSRIMRLRGDRSYTLSSWLQRTNSTTQVTFSLAPTTAVPTNLVAATNLQFVVPASDTNRLWVRYSTNMVLWRYPSEYFQLTISCGTGDHSELPTDVFIDGVQIEEGALTTYSPRYAAEFALHTTNLVNIFSNGPPVIQVCGFNNAASSAARLFAFEVYDHANRMLTNGQFSITCGASNVVTNVLTLVTVTNQGSFRMVGWMDGAPDYRDELIFGTINAPVMSTNYLLGTHSHHLAFNARMLSAMGIKFNRGLSPGGTFRWTTDEPTQGNFFWSDGRIDSQATNGIDILASMGTNEEWPAWANDSTNGFFMLPHYSNWVYQVVNRYKTKIHYWEFWNEPQYTFSTNFMALMHTNFIAAVHNADANAKIVGIGGNYDTLTATNTWALLNSAYQSQVEFISTHLYPTDLGPMVVDYDEGPKTWSRAPLGGKEIWNTETGNKDLFYGFTEVYGFDPTGDYYDPFERASRHDLPKYRGVEMVSINFLRDVGVGFGKYFYYDFRVRNNPAYQNTEYSALEFNNAIRPKLIAIAIQNQFLGYARGRGGVTNSANSNIEAYTATNLTSGDVYGFLWSSDRTNRYLTVTNTSFTQYDVMCNPVTFTNSRVYCGRMPTFLKASGMSIQTLSNTLRFATVTNISDSQPPMASVDMSPNGLVTATNFPLRFKFGALDETTIYTNAYAYRLYPSTSWSGWSGSNYVEYSSVESGTHRLEVKAIDGSGNESDTVNGPAFTLGAEFTTSRIRGISLRAR